MALCSAANIRYVFSFIIGGCLGSLISLIFFYSIKTNYNLHALIATKPHTHGELTDIMGPEEVEVWQDKHYHPAEEEEAIDEFFKEVRVLCWVLTQPSSHKRKAIHVKATWGKRCNKLLFMSSQADPKLPSINLGIRESRDDLWGKTKAAFKYIHKNHLNDADYFFKADDDTYVIVENLRKLLMTVDPKKAVYYGRRFRPFVHQGYTSGKLLYSKSNLAF